MLNALQANPSPKAGFRPQAARSQDSQGGVGFLPGPAAQALRGRVELLLDATALQAAVIEAVNEARTSIKCDLNLLRGREGQEIARALAHRARQGVRVQVLAFGPNTAAFDELIAAAKGLGLAVRRGAANLGNAAGKSLVVDDRTAFVGALGGHRVANGRRALLKLAGEAAWELGRQFNHDWAGAGGHPLPLPELSAMALTASGAQLAVGGVGPARKVARGLVYGALRRAKASIDVVVDVLDDADAIAALVDARRRGVAVRVLLGDAGANAGAIVALSNAGVPVRTLHVGGRGATLELRAAVVDGNALVMGSMPWTRRGFTGGGEVAVEVRGDKAAALLRAVFGIDWETAEPARRPAPAKRLLAAVTPALRALTRAVSAVQRLAIPDVRVGMVKMGGRWKLVTDVR